MASQRTTSTPRRYRATLRTLGRSIVVLAVLVGWVGPGAPARAQSSGGLDGNTYTSEEFGWSVEFDDDVWEAEEIDEAGSAGVQLGSESNQAFANLVVYDDGITDAEECLDDLGNAFETSDDWDDVGAARGVDRPETADGALSALLSGTLSLDQGTVDLILYLECREVDDATLTVTVTSVEESYEDNIPIVEDLLAGIETGGGSSTSDDPDADDPSPEEDPTEESDDGPSNTDPVSRGGDDDPTEESEDEPTPEEEDEPTPEEDPTEEPDEEPTPENDEPVADHAPEDQIGQDEDGELEDGSYRSGLGYALSWDPELFDGELSDEAGAGVRLENPDSGATFEVVAFVDPSIEDCIDAEVARVADSPDYASTAPSTGIRPPTSSDDAAGRILRATEDTTQQARKVIYVECRPLVEGDEGDDAVFLVVRATSDDEDFRASRTLFETLLAAITVGDEPAPEPTDEPEEEPTEEPEEEPTPRPRRTPTPEPEDEPEEEPAAEDLGETDLGEGVFVGSQFPFRVEWSTAYWQAVELDEGIQEGVSLVAEAGAFGRIVTADTPANYGTDQCLLDNVEQWAAVSPDLAEFTPPTGQEIAFPDGALTAYGVGTLTLDDGTEVPLLNVAGCIELGDGEDYLVMSFQTFSPVYAETSAAFNEVLATIELGETSGDQRGIAAPAEGSAQEVHARPARLHPAVSRRPA